MWPLHSETVFHPFRWDFTRERVSKISSKKIELLCCVVYPSVMLRLMPRSRSLSHRRMGKFKLQQVLWQVDQFVFIRFMRRERARKQLIIHSNFFLFFLFVLALLARPFLCAKVHRGRRSHWRAMNGWPRRRRGRVCR